MSGSPSKGDIYLEPGGLFFGKGHGKIVTILGSCVAVTLWHPRHRVGAMCHFVLPSRVGAVGREQDPRYGDEALAVFAARLRKENLGPWEFEAGIFGGGNMFPRLVQSTADKVGPRNIAIAQSLVSQAGYPLKLEDVGEDYQRHLTLDLNTGKISLRKRRMG